MGSGSYLNENIVIF